MILSIHKEVIKIKSRIREVRIKFGLSMQAFGDRIGIASSSVSLLESGRNNPSERTIRAICREFNVNRDWLETGEGEPYIEFGREEELHALIGDLLNDTPKFKHRLITVLLRMKPEEWAMLERKAKELLEETEKDALE